MAGGWGVPPSHRQGDVWPHPVTLFPCHRPHRPWPPSWLICIESLPEQETERREENPEPSSEVWPDQEL